jgi:acetyl-CoA carboxylase biotin carboxyl carrier protein
MAESNKSRGRRPVKAQAAAPRTTRKPKMTEPQPSSQDVFEVDRIRRLVELMKEHDLSEIDLRESRQRIRICRGPRVAAAAPAQFVQQSAPPPMSAPAVPAATAPKATTDSANATYIKSPMVGTFYSRPNPKAEAFVKVGDQVDTNTVVCIIEAMKVFNEIPAEIRGKITAILVEDGEAVDFDKPLFKVEA